MAAAESRIARQVLCNQVHFLVKNAFGVLGIPTLIIFQEKAVRLWTRKRRGDNWEFDWMMMNEDLYEVLWSRCQKKEQDEWVFFNRLQGTRYLYRPKLMGTICKRAGVQKFGFHTIRHFVAGYLFDRKKVSMPVISKLLRHNIKCRQTSNFIVGAQLAVPGRG